MEHIYAPKRAHLHSHCGPAGTPFTFQQEYHVCPPEVPDRLIGYGAFGMVWAVTDPRNGKRLAMKKLTNLFDYNLLHCKRVFREIYMLSKLRHQNLLSLVDIVCPEPRQVYSEICLLMELMQSDLGQIIASPQPLTTDHVKIFLYQVLRGVKYIHSAGLLHRDLKPGNLLVNNNCLLKIGDFGLMRTHEPDESVKMTDSVVTPNYRAPELLLASPHHDFAIDMWSIGCIFAELLSRKVLFKSNGPFQQLDMILQLLGTPSSSDLAGVGGGALHYVMCQPRYRSDKSRLYSISPMVTHHAIQLLSRLLVFNPKKRITASEALTYPYLDEGRSRFHGYLCECCQSSAADGVKLHPVHNLEPTCRVTVDPKIEALLTSVHQVRDVMYTFVENKLQQQRRMPLKINPRSAVSGTFQTKVSVGAKAPMVPVAPAVPVGGPAILCAMPVQCPAAVPFHW